MKKRISFLSLAIIFIGCSTPVETVINKNPDEAQLVIYSDNALSYSIVADKKDFIGDWSSRRTSGGQTAHSLWNGHIDDGKDSYVDLYHLDSACSPSTLRELDPHQREVLEVTEQRDKANDLYVLKGVERPTGPEVDLSPEKLKEWWSYQDTRYLFCSQHAGKTVAIVITQKTDNPALATQIFDSFRWTK